MAASRKQILIGVLLLVTIAFGFGLRTYWNADAAVTDDGSYVLSGNDPYYHKRAVDHITENWETLEHDPMLNYPLGSVNPNPPLFEWSMAVGSQVMEPAFGDQETATWWSVLLAPALWGTLTIIPVFLIGRMFAGDWGGLLAAFFIATSPEHMSRTSLGFADHDAMVILLAVTGFYFVLRALKDAGSRRKYTTLSQAGGAYKDWFTTERASAGAAILAGGSFGALALVWKGFPYVFGIVLAYAGLQFLINHWKGMDVARPVFILTTVLGLAMLMGLPYYAAFGLMNFWNPALFLFIAMVALGSFFLATQEYPSVLVLPGLVGLIGGFAAVMFLVVPTIAQSLLYRFVYFRGTRLYQTIAEAQPADFSQLAFAVGPIPFFLFIAGLLFMVYRLWAKRTPEDLFLGTWVAVDFFLALTASRFLSQSVPSMALLAAMATIWMIRLMDLPNLFRQYKTAGFGGVTRSMGGPSMAAMGMLAVLAIFLGAIGFMAVAIVLGLAVALFLFNASLGLKSGGNTLHVVTVLFMGALVLAPNAALAVDAAIPTGFEQERASQARAEALEDVTAEARAQGLGGSTVQEIQRALNQSRSVDEFRDQLSDISLRLGIPQSTMDAIAKAAEDEFRTISLYQKRLGAFGQNFLSPGWNNALTHLATLDTEEEPADRPGFLSWWDYGHWAIQVGKHPAVADNFQHGYQMAGNFLVAQNESHAIQIMAARHAKLFEEETFVTTLTDMGVEPIVAEEAYEDFIHQRFPYIEFSEDPQEDVALSSQWMDTIESITGKHIRYIAADNRMFPVDDPRTTNRVENPSIFYAPVTLAGQDPESYVETAVINTQTGEQLNEREQQRLLRNPNAQAQLGQVLNYHEPFFNSMYYRVYQGLPVNPSIEQQGQSIPRAFDAGAFQTFYQDPRMLRGQGPVDGLAVLAPEILQGAFHIAPGFGLEHFRLVHANDAVRLLEYFPGAIVEGEVTLAGQPQEGVRVTVFDDAGAQVLATNPQLYASRNLTAEDLHVPHDSVVTDANGTYRLVVPFSTTEAGITIKATQETRSGAPPLLASETLQVSREQANAKETFQVDLDVEPASLTGTVFLDTNGNATFDEGEQPLEGANVSVQGQNATTDASGTFTLDNLAPGQHTAQVDLDGYRLAGQAGRVTLTAGQDNEIDLAMEFEPIKVDATVRDQLGGTVEGVNTLFEPVDPNGTAQTASAFSQVNGTLTADLQPGTYTISGNNSQAGGNTTLAITGFEIVAGTGASQDADGNLVLEPKAKGVELAIEVAPES